ncbi:MAG: transmembrane(s)protein [candidate division WS6 bacterium 36_33]|uniref:Transmembrane(S)protein n=1 Tax=candidate division WS6 bacterium 36_33 TaxID=1641388 RepID=A0A101GZ37_9BACT|nr:MAG: transmembrane(s)protein [candidate division WS6 bacterium 36_33]
MAVTKNIKPSKTKREIEGLSENIKDTRLTIKDLVIPLSVFLILILLVIFLFVPMVKTAISFRGEYRTTKERTEELEEVERKLREIDESTLQTDLINAKVVIPQTLRVASFMSYIADLAREKNLSSDTLTAGDSQTSVVRRSQEEEGEQRVYFGVSSPLNYEGELSNVLSFLDNLYEASPYVISISGVELRKGAGDKWVVDLNVMGYYVPESTMKTNINKNFESYLEYQDIVDIFSQKAAQLQ